VATLLGMPYSTGQMGQMRYDLRRLRMKGLIRRLPHSNTYVLTTDWQRVAIFYTKVYSRLALAAANDPPAPLPLRQALRAIDRHVADYYIAEEARMLT
jgi:hypothetical protein